MARSRRGVYSRLKANKNTCTTAIACFWSANVPNRIYDSKGTQWLRTGFLQLIRIYFVQWPAAENNKKNKKWLCLTLTLFYYFRKLFLKGKKKYRVVHISLWFQNGVWPPPLIGWQKYRVVHLPLWFQNGVWPSPLQQGGSKNTRWFISQLDFTMGCDPPPPICNNNKLNNNNNWDRSMTCRPSAAGKKAAGSTTNQVEVVYLIHSTRSRILYVLQSLKRPPSLIGF